MTIQELKTEALRLKGEIEALNSLLIKLTKTEIQRIETYVNENQGTILDYVVRDTKYRGNPDHPKKITSFSGGSIVEEFRAIEELLSEFSELCDEINLIP